jgi:hypothetical protein
MGAHDGREGAVGMKVGVRLGLPELRSEGARGLAAEDVNLSKKLPFIIDGFYVVINK